MSSTAVKTSFNKSLATTPTSELEETNKKTAKKLARNLVAGVASTVAIHFASSALIGYIENKTKEPEAGNVEVPTDQ